MDDEFLGDFNYVVCNTDSQKSLGTTVAYSQDLTDGSSGQESHCTYVLQADSDSARSRRAAAPCAAGYDAISLVSASNVSQSLALEAAADADTSPKASDALAGRATAHEGPAADLHAYSILSQETFTQTSKTIFELAQTNYINCNLDTHAIETQTSCLSIVENKTIEYRIEVSGSQTRFSRSEILARPRGGARDGAGGSRDGSEGASSGTLMIVDDGPETKSSGELEPVDNSSEENADTSKYDTDFTDSLEDECSDRREHRDDASDESVAKSVDEDVEELYTNLEKSFDLRKFDRPPFDVPRYATLSPLSEETCVKTESFIQVSRTGNTRTQREENFGRNQKCNKTFEFINKLCTGDVDREQCKLPPIQRDKRRRPYSPAARAPAAPRALDSGRGDWAAGEGASLAAGTGITASGDPQRLPAIRAPSPAIRAPSPAIRAPSPAIRAPSPASRGDGAAPRARPPRDSPRETISIHSKIQQLKMQAQAGNKRLLYGSSTTESRSSSADSASERGGGAGAGVTARGCEALCADVIARMRQHACSWSRPPCEPRVGAVGGWREGGDGCAAKWEAAVEVLEDVPRLFRGFWRALPEHRVADLLRLVTAQVESPRTRVARAACAALAALLSNTSYTKKPEFDEAVAALLAKTGSMTAGLRRAANLALDEVVARTPPAPALQALCLFGAEHASGLVRCAAARLLVVAAALAAGGRGLLRARPRSAAAARRRALRALAALLADRSQDTSRKYAERLYCLLRPLAGFEAFFLADVDARTACRLMKKYDALLAPAPLR